MSTETQNSTKPYLMTVNGQGRSADTYFEVLNPSTQDIVGLAPQSNQQDVDAAVAAAKNTFPTWSSTPHEERVALCQQIVTLIKNNSEALATLITQEQGKPLNGLGSRWEIGGACAWAEYTTSLNLGVKVLQDNEEGRLELHRKPLGVVASITPWNFPVLIAIWHIMPALVTGNTVVIKPSPYTPLSTLKLVELMNQVLPPGVVNAVAGEDTKENSVGQLLSSHPDVRKVVFTGSTATGKSIMRSAADSMKRLTLELGGNDAGIVLPDADPKAIAEGLFWGAFINNGQTCAALKRLYVHESIHDDVCEALVEFAKQVPYGDGMDENSILGPLCTPFQFEKVRRLVSEAVAKGKVHLGGTAANGQFFPPTIISGLENGDSLVDEEQFGPVLPIIRFTDIEDAIQAANDSSSGLGGSVWSSDTQAAASVAKRLECGSVWINRHGMIQPNAPFGGVKSSGLGVEFGEEGLAEYTDIQVVFN
ncbi:aldehyde dehydrogenase family protein [Grimontia sp. NTOU-MAR1]|uniref:aldehyde dehydrogenase family protein n=1 Tax=Grimontia sp. NTOU-MAR1 TaxID=3111011 RepID=UPI002DBFB05E|nr:aldehyde dehydrogenase family protein [Grimontia sp. NTOU-MAR1]WRV99756.1 aldehyde dehydrogenase family protein [Grimontia sp. NTOU-MAR1]